ncbi:Type I transmembrane sorting receptor [Mortierella sp. AD094]|nr:Type I transmembrane sorting receptor [Mortierella sp. AD094]
MKFTASLLSLAVAVLAVAEAGSHDGHVGLSRNPHYKHNTKAQIAKLNRRYPRLNILGRATALAGTGTVPLKDVSPDLEYYGTVKVGTPAQDIRLDFDTGSSDIWFPSTACTTSACKSHHRFNTGKSSSYKKDGRKWSIEYGDGSSASGVLGSDFVNVGGINVRQTIGLSTKESSEFDGSPEDGLFGLAFANIESVFGVKTFMDNAIAGNKLKEPIISVFLPSERRNGGKGGNYLFGAIDHTRYTGNLTYAPVTQQGYWQIAVQGLQVDGKTVAGATSQGIIDTGTTLLILGDSAAKAVHKSIKGSENDPMEGWTVPCSLKKSTKNIAFKLGGVYFNVPLADLAYEPIETGSSTCVSGVQGGQDGLWILGDVFIKNNYVVFDHSKNPRIGIAPLKY